MKLFLQIMSWTIFGFMALGFLSLAIQGTLDGWSAFASILVSLQCVTTLIYINDVKEAPKKTYKRK